MLELISNERRNCMLEQSRQFVIFGNFTDIDFEKVIKLRERLSDLPLKVSATYDPSQNNRFSLSNGLPKLCPSLHSMDKKMSIIFGNNRIHIQENNVDSTSYKEFNKTSLRIIETIIESSNISINRIAINGQFLVTDPKIINKFYSFYFKNPNNSSEPFEWSFRTNNIVQFSNDFNYKINTIISLIKNKINDEISELTIAYDFNTVINSKNIFQYNNILLFNKHGIDFRNQILLIK